MNNKKNILAIICDQLSATALQAYGNNYVQAPNIEAIAKNGTIIENAYVACPLCQPSRASFWTSKYPHQTNVLTNLKDQGFPALPDEITTIGDLFSRAGYECIHFGKDHSYGALRGFKTVQSEKIPMERIDPAIILDYETFLDEDTTRKTEEYLKDNHEAPFFAVADLENPHNICFYIGENRDGHKEFNLERELPDLPANFDFDDIKNRPEFIQYLCCAHRRQRHAAHWNEDDFKHYLFAYYFYIELVDKQIGRILKALEESGQKDNTLIVFFADHGEGMAAHKLVTKYGVFYEESNRVPFMFSGPGIQKERRVEGLSSLLDLMPTLLDYAGIPLPNDLEGISLLPQLKGMEQRIGERTIFSEWYDEFKDYTIPGRMVRDENFKYTVYREPDSEELFDMKNDRLEKVNLAGKPEYADKLEAMRRKLIKHTEKTGDNFFELTSVYDPIHRKHAAGMQHHEGLSAVEIYTNIMRSNLNNK